MGTMPNRRQLRRALFLRIALALVLIAASCFGLDYHQRSTIDNDQRVRLRDFGNDLGTALQQELNTQFFVLRSLAAYARLAPEMAYGDFNTYLQGLGPRPRALRSVTWAPGAIIRHISPATGNEAFLGYDLLADPLRQELLRRAIREDRLFVVGPIPLLEGGSGVIARQPVFVQHPGSEGFLGFVAIVIDLDSLISDLLAKYPDKDLQLALRGHDGLGARGEIFHGEAALFDSPRSQLHEIHLPAGSWQMALQSTALPDVVPSTSPLAVLVFGLLGGLAWWALYRSYRDRLSLSELSAAQRQNEIRLEQAQQLAGIASWELRPQTRMLHWSQELNHIFELEPQRNELPYDEFLALVHEEDRARLDERYRQAQRERNTFQVVYRLRTPDGAVKHVLEAFRAEFDRQGRVLRIYGMAQDITERILQESALRASEERYRTIANYAFGWEYWQRPDGQIPYMSKDCVSICGYLAEEFQLRPGLLHDIVHDDDRADFMHSQQAMLGDSTEEGMSEGELNFRIFTHEGELRWIAHSWRRARGEQGQALGIRVRNTDITVFKDAELQARQLAFFDSLTGLPNRRLLDDRLTHALKQARRHRRIVAVLFLDIDKFKQVNDQHGHDCGDRLLIETGQRLLACVRTGDTVARLGGDEFVVVLVEIASVEDVCVVADKILDALQQPYQLEGIRLHSRNSLGIALFDADSADEADNLLEKADAAMYAAKQLGGNRFVIDGAAAACVAASGGPAPRQR